MRIQSSHRRADRGLDPYFTPSCATIALLHIERGRIPHRLWEPAAGGGNISKILLQAGYQVTSSDIAEYGWDGCTAGVDYLTAAPPDGVMGIITNPPFAQAADFALKAFNEVDYLALLLRTNFLESADRRERIFRRFPPTRIHISSRRLPMMHREGWTGKKSASNTCFAWFCWEASAPQEPVSWFDWKQFTAARTEEGVS